MTILCPYLISIFWLWKIKFAHDLKYLSMKNDNNQSKVHEEVLGDINKQLDHIMEIEQREQEHAPKEKSCWQRFIRKFSRKK